MDEANVARIKSADMVWMENRPAAPVAGTQAPPPSAATVARSEQHRAEQTDRSNRTALMLVYITTFGFFVLIFSLIALDRIPATPGVVSPYKDILLTLMGIVGTAWAGIISFYFGSSVGSRQQSQTLQDISRGTVASHPGGQTQTA